MKQQQNARARAAYIIERWEKNNPPLARLLDEDFQNFPFDKVVDGQLCRALVYGVVRWKGYLDQILKKYSKHPLNKMDADAKQVLRIALYQMLFMDRIPVSAAINESVKILKKSGRPRWLTGFVNGLLRNVSRESDELPAHGGDEGYPPHIQQSYPEWLYGRWEERYGAKRAVSICRAGNKPAPICLRTNNRNTLIEKLNAAGTHAKKGLFSPQAVILPDFRGRVENLMGYDEGRFQVQDEAAQLASYLLNVKKAARVLDACAGVGGKTTHLAELLPDKSKITALEPDSRRISLLKQNLGRLGLSQKVDIVESRLEDLKVPDEWGFDTVLLDAPCSGLGIIRHHPDIRWNRGPEDMLRYQEIQLELLKCAANLLAPSGVIVYATCSTEPEENESVIDTFLNEHSEFIVDDCRSYLPEEARPLVDERGYFHPLPDQGIDGFFAARLIREN